MNHSHVLYDSDPHFKIDPISRKITNESSTKTTIIQYDHNSERFTFEMPRYIEGHDMASCNVVEIHYLNVEANTKIVKAGVYTVDDLQIKPDDENSVVCSWLVPNNATRFVGQLQFLIRFSCAYDDTGKIDYVWNTAVYTGIAISSGIYNSDSPSDNPLPAFNFVTTITGEVLKFFVGTQAEYDALPHEDTRDLFAIITDDATLAELRGNLENMRGELNDTTANVNGLINGNISIENANKATRDGAGNVITETYGNFGKTWSGGGGMSYPRLSGAGTYQFVVKVDYDSRYFESSAVVYWDGESATVVSLPTAFNVTYDNAHYYRLIISADGSTHVEYCIANFRDGYVNDWVEISYFNSSEIKNNLNIKYKKIL